MTPETINDLFYHVVERHAPRVALFKTGGEWRDISSRDMYQWVVGVTQALQSWGIRKGDRIALISENRPEWAVADFATVLCGAADVPLYPTLTPDQTAYILKDSGARIAFVSTAEQANKVLSIRELTDVERIVVMDRMEPLPAGVVHMWGLMEQGPREIDPEFDERARSTTPEDLATIIYTSGTTGTPKGVMLTHENIISNVCTSVRPFAWDSRQTYLSFLPLSHITARHLDYTLFDSEVTIAYCPSFDLLPQYLKEVRPTILVSVPRVFEKVRAEVYRRTGSGIKKVLLDWAIGVGMRHIDEVVAGKTPKSFAWKMADKLVLSKIREVFGGRVGTAISGGAPLPLELGRWYAAIGLRICEGYGLTETSPVISVNTPQRCKLGTVGPPLPNLQVRIAEDGELLVKGPSVFKSYWKLPEDTAQAFTPDGWFKTGDIAEIDPEGFLKITDRKKDLIKTSGGKFIAPQPIENALKANALIGQAVVIGDRRKFAIVLLVPHFPLLEDWAHANNVDFNSREELVANERVRALYDGIVADANTRLAQFETLKRVILIPAEFSLETGELTPKMSVRRRVVEEKYKHLIDRVYADAESHDKALVG